MILSPCEGVEKLQYSRWLLCVINKRNCIEINRMSHWYFDFRAFKSFEAILHVAIIQSLC